MWKESLIFATRNDKLYKSMMKKKVYKAIVCLCCVATSLYAQDRVVELTNPDESCTSIAAGKLATTDGSVMTSQTCDGTSRTWMEVVPAQNWPDTAMLDIYWDLRHTESKNDRLGVKLKGSIPQAPHTYAYLNTGYPCMNEKQLAMGETTIVGRKELRNPKGLFHIEDLQGIALQRCSTAREAVLLMGRLAEQYGYRDGGECLTVADKKELWFFEITGAGPEEPGALWVARCIPDDHVTVSANTPRISDVDFKDKDNYMYSEGLKEKARKLGYWDGKEPFKFWKVIHETGKKPFTIRDFFVLKTLAPSLDLSMDMEELPLSVKPDRQVSLADMNRLLRETYEGTEWDMTKDMMVTKKIKDKDGTERDTTYKSPLAQNWMTNDMFDFLNAQRGEKKIGKQRTISVVWCAYSFVIQCRDWLPDEVGGVCWWSEDNPGESPRVPLFAGMTDVPESFKVCGHKRYRPDAALWTYRRTNRLAQVSWGHGRKLIEPAVLSFEQKAADEMPLVENKVSALIREGKKEEARAYLTRYSFDFIYSTLRCWEEMEGQLWHKFGRGF